MARLSLLAGLVGAAVAIIGAFLNPRAALQLYLAAAIGWTAVPIGCLLILMMMHLVGGAWREELEEPLETGCRTLPVAALLFLPVLLGSGEIYPWAGESAADLGTFKAIYLGQWFFALRTIAYFAIWILLSLLLLRADRPRPGVASVGLILYALTASLAGVDWAMSLEPRFVSSIYGLLFLAHQMLAALAMAIAVKTLATARTVPTVGLGALLLSVILLWAYLHAMQYIVIWAGDLPDEIAWYLNRAAGGWTAVVWLLGLLQGAVPFFLLLSSRCRSNPAILGGIALLVLIMRLVESYWLTVPAMDLGSTGLFPAIILAFATLAAVGGLWSASFFYGFGWAERHPSPTLEGADHG